MKANTEGFSTGYLSVGRSGVLGQLESGRGNLKAWPRITRIPRSQNNSRIQGPAPSAHFEVGPAFWPPLEIRGFERLLKSRVLDVV